MSTADPQARLLGDSSRYYLLQAALMASGLITMPLTTRYLSREEYGALSLIFTLVAATTTLAQLGFPNATTRFFAEQRLQGRAGLRRYCEVMLTSAGLSALIVAAFMAPVLPWIGARPGGGSALPHVGTIVALVVVRVLIAVVLEIYRAGQQANLFAAARMIRFYGTAALLVVLLPGHRSALTVLVATLLTEWTLCAVCLAQLARSGTARRPRFDWPIAAAATRYGWPLAIAGWTAVAADQGDRFLINHYLGVDAVATYAVPYELAQKLAVALFAPVQMAALPIVFRLWSEGRLESARESLSTLATNLVAMAIPVGALFLILNREIILLLASAKYEASAGLTWLLLPGVFLGELSFVVGCGLRLSRQTAMAAGISLFGLALNVALNLLLLPRFGLRGAAAATTLTYATTTAVLYWMARDVLRLRLRGPLIAKSAAATLLMAASLHLCGTLSDSAILDIAARGALGVTVAGGTLLLTDREWRRSLGPLVQGVERVVNRSAS